MKRRDLAFVILGTVAAAVCVRLGIWQLDRLSERRALNDRVRSRAEMPPIPFAQLPRDTGEARYRRVKISGTYDFANQFTLTTRSRMGSPGVNIVTPVKLPGTDTAVLVNRGWIYAPDGMTADPGKWPEPAALEGDAYVQNYQSREGSPVSPRNERAYRWMDYRTLSQDFPYPIAPYYLVLIGETQNPAPDIPPRVPVPPLDEGSHQSYAFQWFSFAAVFIIGMVLYLRRK
jgi:surfeit locus 1 family protein